MNSDPETNGGDDIIEAQAVPPDLPPEALPPAPQGSSDATPPPVPASHSNPPVAAALHASEPGGIALALRRVFLSDFYGESATKSERQMLANAEVPITSPLAQNYAAWRRSMLWFSACAMPIVLLFLLIGFIENAAGNNQTLPGIMEMIVFYSVVELAIVGVSVGLTIRAAVRWHALKSSCKLALFAWLTTFCGSFLMLIVPSSAFIDHPAVRTLMALLVVLIIGPKLMALFAGLVRSSMTVKTMLPESSLPGLVAVIVAPLYSLFFATALIVSIQLNLPAAITIAFGLMAAAPLFYVFHAGRIMPPQDAGQGHQTVRFVRLQATSVLILGAAIFVLYLLSESFVAEQISVSSVLQLVASFVSNILLLTVVMTDVLVGLLRKEFETSKVAHAASLHDALARKLDELAGLSSAVDVTPPLPELPSEATPGANNSAE